MDKVYSHPPWWSYLMAMGFIILGIYFLQLWRKYRNPNASPWERAVFDAQYLYSGIGSIASGTGLLIIFIYQACTGRIAK